MIHEDDQEIAVLLDTTVTHVRKMRHQVYAALRTELCDLGYVDMPETDEGFFLWIRGLQEESGKTLGDLFGET